MKTVQEITNKTLATLESLPIQSNREEKLQSTLPNSKLIINPCKTEWQRKFLGIDCYDPKLSHLAERTEAFCARWAAMDYNKSMLVLAGESGCAKTHVARAIYQFCTASRFTLWPEKHTKLMSTKLIRWPEEADFLNTGDYENEFLMAELFSRDLLVIDDIGAENDAWKKATNKLCQIFSRRESKFTVVTTNIQPQDWSSKFDTRIADRLMRNSEVIDLFGVDSYTMI